jgi:hypothetical protein
VEERKMEKERINIKSFNGAASDDENLTEPRWNVEDYRIEQDFEAATQVSVVNIDVRKPHKQEWFRAHRTLQFPAAVLELNPSGSVYLVHPSLRERLSHDVYDACIFPCINRSNEIFLWTVRLPKSDNRTNQFSESALEAISMARETWIRRQWSAEDRSHVVYKSKVLIPDPKWPEDCSIEDLINRGFKRRFIADYEHEVLRRLRGEA